MKSEETKGRSNTIDRTWRNHSAAAQITHKRFRLMAYDFGGDAEF